MCRVGFFVASKFVGLEILVSGRGREPKMISGRIDPTENEACKYVGTWRQMY